MLNEYLRKQEDCVLWALLADIGEVMGNRTRKMQSDNFWIAAASEVTKEIDRRLFIDADNEDDFDNEED